MPRKGNMENRLVGRFNSIAFISLVLWVAIGGRSFANDITVSLGTGPNSIRNIAVRKWAEEVKARSQNQLVIKVYESGAKFKDRVVPTALRQNAIDMAVPAKLHFARYIPEMAALFTPVINQITWDEARALMDGPIGLSLYEKIEEKFDVVMIGRAIDLGHITTFTKYHPIKSASAYAGLRLRVAGSVAYLRRYKAMGASPLSLSWQEVPQALQTDMIDGVVTTFDSVRSARLWEAGLSYAVVDNLSFHQFLPAITKKKWASLKEHHRHILVTAWADIVVWQRQFAEEQQYQARKEAEANGVTITILSDEEKAKSAEIQETVHQEILEILNVNSAFASKLSLELQQIKARQ